MPPNGTPDPSTREHPGPEGAATTAPEPPRSFTTDHPRAAHRTTARRPTLTA